MTAALCGVLVAGPAAHPPAVSAQADQRIEINFRAMVGEEPFACGQRYGGIGTTGATVLPSDFRFYVSEVSLLDEAGNTVPLTLEQDGRWQYQNVALLDFENKQDPCANGTEETRDVIVGTVPAGTYTGLRFTLGVPFDPNHQDATLASSPMNLTSLFWTWQGGYKFFRVDLEPDRMGMGPMAAPKPEGHMAAKPQAGAGHGDSSGWAIHLGSTGCQSASMMQAPADCANPNRSTIELAPFAPATSVVLADLKALLAGTNVEANQPESAFGCMSAPNDGDCAAIMAGFGLPFAGTASPGQTLFRVQ
jgi:uncharacterized repeat protein (TIGR04052 family)